MVPPLGLAPFLDFGQLSILRSSRSIAHGHHQVSGHARHRGKSLQRGVATLSRDCDGGSARRQRLHMTIFENRFLIRNELYGRLPKSVFRKR